MASPSNQRVVIACGSRCQFHPDKLPPGVAEALRVIRENGAGERVLTKRASELLGRPIPQSSIRDHIKHYREAATVGDTPEPEQDKGPRPSDVEILDELIVAGWRNSKNWKPTIRDTLEAMKLKSQMTGNSAFENMLQAMEAGMREAEGSEAEGPMPENPDAVAAEEERPVEEDE